MTPSEYRRRADEAYARMNDARKAGARGRYRRPDWESHLTKAKAWLAQQWNSRSFFVEPDEPLEAIRWERTICGPGQIAVPSDVLLELEHENARLQYELNSAMEELAVARGGRYG